MSFLLNFISVFIAYCTKEDYNKKKWRNKREHYEKRIYYFNSK